MSTKPPEDGADGSGLTLTQLWHHHRRYPYLLAKVALAAAVLVLFFVGLRSVEGVLFPLAVSMLLAYVFDPAVDWFEARGAGRTAGIGMVLGLGALGVLVFVLFLYPTIAHLLGMVGDKLPQLLGATGRALPWIQETFGVEVPENLSAVMDEYGATVRAQLPGLAKGASSWIGELWGRTGALVASLVNLVAIPVFTFYFLRDFDKMKATAADFIPLPHRAGVLDRLAQADVVVGAYVRGQVEVAAILAVLYAVGLAIVFGVAGAGVTSGIAVGLLTGLLNVIPYFGFVVGIVLSISVVLIDWAGWWPVFGVVAVFGIVQGLEGYLITPRVVGDKVGLSPVTVIIVLLLGTELMGLLGVVLAIPVAGAVRVLLPDAIDWYKGSNFYTGALDAAQANAAGERKMAGEPAAGGDPVDERELEPVEGG